MFEIYKDHSQKCADEYVNMRKYELYKQQLETQQRLKQHSIIRDQHQQQSQLTNYSPQQLPTAAPAVAVVPPSTSHHVQYPSFNNNIDNTKKIQRTKSNNLQAYSTPSNLYSQYPQQQVYNVRIVKIVCKNEFIY